MTISRTFALAFWFAFRMYAVVVITTPQDLIVVLLCVMMMATSIGQISAPLAAAHQAAEACAIFHTIIDAPKPTYGAARGDDEVRADGDIALINVNFAYPTRPDVRVLDQLSLTFPAGKVTAIVGPSGSGKSTIVGILERWYEFDGDPATNPIVSPTPCYSSWLEVSLPIFVRVRFSSSATASSQSAGVSSPRSTSSGGVTKSAWSSRTTCCSTRRYTRTWRTA